MSINNGCSAWIAEEVEAAIKAAKGARLNIRELARRLAVESAAHCGRPLSVDATEGRVRRWIRRRKVGQAERWRQAESRLAAVVEFMMSTCHAPDQIDEGTRLELLLQIETLKVFEVDLRAKGGE